MTEVPFEISPRRVVRTPSGRHALVLVRRNADPNPPPPWLSNWDPRVIANVWHWIRRIVTRDRSWLVEVFVGVDRDGTRPWRAANDAQPTPDRARANALAEQACCHLEQKGYSAGLLGQLASEVEST
jgi:hypothetical protein